MPSNTAPKRHTAKVSVASQLHAADQSALRRYQAKVLGEPGLWRLLRYELCFLLSANLSGAPGYVLRKRLIGGMLGQTGAGLILGKGLVVRHPGRISCGHRVAVDDYVLLDASGAGEQGIRLEDEVVISRQCVIQGKLGPISIGYRSDIGCNTVLSSVSGITIGQCVLLAGNCYLGGGQYAHHRKDVPMMDQGLTSTGTPLTIEDDVWVGAGAVILDGVTLGRGCIIGAGAVVTRDIPPYAIAAGIPARVLRMREETNTSVT